MRDPLARLGALDAAGRAPARCGPGSCSSSGISRRVSSAQMRPDQSVPVTTVPIPLRVKTRSTGSRATPSSRCAAPAGAAGGFFQHTQQQRHALAGLGADADDGCVFVRRAAQKIFDVGLNQLEHLLVDEVGLGDGDDALGDAEHLDDGHVLAGLGHDPVVSGDHQQEDVDAGGARRPCCARSARARGRRRRSWWCRKAVRARRSPARWRCRVPSPPRGGRCRCR